MKGLTLEGVWARETLSLKEAIMTGAAISFKLSTVQEAEPPDHSVPKQMKPLGPASLNDPDLKL